MCDDTGEVHEKCLYTALRARQSLILLVTVYNVCVFGMDSNC